jgi:GNAT superfamily N-acetyltransferase
MSEANDSETMNVRAADAVEREGSRRASSGVRVERATERDVPLILQMIRDLAEYERMADQVVATEAGLREALFGARPGAEVILAYDGDQPAGFALFFHNFSTFVGRRGLYLEDLFVKPAFRGRGIGKRLLVELARIATARGCGRFEWAVLDWNEPAIGFYKKLGAQPMHDWTVFRVDGRALTELADGET